MADSRFTKEEATNVIAATQEIMKAFPKNKFRHFVGHFNDLFLFLEEAKKAAPEKQFPSQRRSIRRCC